MKKIVFLTGAGMSQESGIDTFRDSGGLWENHDIMDVASPQGWAKDPKLVLDFYNARRAQLKKVKPNKGHRIIQEFEKHFDVTVVTQNVDDLHERANSTKILHLHGELTKVRSCINEAYIQSTMSDIQLGDLCPQGGQMRPHIVWFGEAVPAIEGAIDICQAADIIVVIGTSLAVYPAASLMEYAKQGCQLYYIDPHPNLDYIKSHPMPINVIQESATFGMELLKRDLI